MTKVMAGMIVSDEAGQCHTGPGQLPGQIKQTPADLCQTRSIWATLLSFEYC